MSSYRQQESIVYFTTLKNDCIVLYSIIGDQFECNWWPCKRSMDACAVETGRSEGLGLGLTTKTTSDNHYYLVVLNVKLKKEGRGLVVSIAM